MRTRSSTKAEREKEEGLLSHDHSEGFDHQDVEEIVESIKEAQYFDASSMSPLTPAALAAVARLRAYKPPPFKTWDCLPVSRRAAVLILLFADRRGDLRVVITMRASTLRNFSGQAAFPGGKADSLEETPWEIARREAWEEIGLPKDDSKIPRPFLIEHLCLLPCSMARTTLAVRPCVAFLHSDDTNESSASTVEDNMIPRLDAKEVAAVFSAPFHNFLSKKDETREGDVIPGKRSDWYSGQWIDYHETRWKMHNFFVPITNQRVSKPKVREGGQAAIAEHLDNEEENGMTRYKVWGMTGRMLVDAARLAYDEEPEFDNNGHVGDEEMIESQHDLGNMQEKESGTPALTDAQMKAVHSARASSPNAKLTAPKM